MSDSTCVKFGVYHILLQFKKELKIKEFLISKINDFKLDIYCSTIVSRMVKVC